ncbi:DUF488 domain-containing protein [Acinetobacter populi]|uniref:MarR family transcriptional regulator n=1 Tax=Acinetobacter populi TaxID=1582270 RepID=A0A1Z9YU88_9GAMM|nr:DUF488 domain-containing protein [Acinetobacter populi]OUY05767.1 hypothetical protein CAP51_16235 [Acinetobacter populi]
MTILLKRIYDAPAASDGLRILVDRLWPRGVKKADAKIDWWMKEVTPSTELRQWYGHDPDKWIEFQQKYRAELKGNPKLKELHDLAKQQTISLIYAAKNTAITHAIVLKQMIEEAN